MLHLCDMKLSEINTFGNILFLTDIKCIDIVYREGSAITTKHKVTIACGNEVLLSEQYVGWLGQEITVDFRDVFAALLMPAEPSEEAVIHSSYKKTCSITSEAVDLIPAQSGTYNFTLYGFDRRALDILSDIDYLRVPEDYILPLTTIGFGESEATWKLSTDGATLMRGSFPKTSEPYTLFLNIPDSSKPLRPTITLGDKTLYGPTLKPSPGKFEQYLFANEYGGFDNIPMDGKLEFLPEFEFETGVLSGSKIMTSSDRTDKWKQNSGFLTSATIKALGKLLTSRHIWHLVEGAWKRIVIVSCDLSHNSHDSLHSITFEYKYLYE